MANQTRDRARFVYVASFEAGARGGIYAYRLDLDHAALTLAGANHQLDRLLFIRRHPSRPRLFATRVRDGNNDTVAAYSIDESTGELTLLNERSAGGACPCYLDVAGDLLLTANYSGANVAVLPIADDGRLLPASCVIDHRAGERSPEPDNASNPHSIVVDPAGPFVLCADLGIGEVLVYRLEREHQRLVAHDPASVGVHAGAGPRHLAFGSGGDRVYVINEHDATLMVYRWDSQAGTLHEIQSLSTLPPAVTVTNHAADLHVHPSGRFIYVSNRGHDSIAVLAVDARTGKVAPIQHEPTRGSFPRSLALDPGGQLLLAANERSHNLAIFRIDAHTGRIQLAGPPIQVPSPTCVTLVD